MNTNEQIRYYWIQQVPCSFQLVAELLQNDFIIRIEILNVYSVGLRIGYS